MRWLSVLRLLPALILLNAATLAFPQESDPASDRLPETGRVYRLTLDAATRLALLNNFDIQLAQYDLLIARTGLAESLSLYDTVISAAAGVRDDQSKNASAILGSKALTNTYSLDVTKKFPTGTTLSAGLSNERNWSNSSFVTLNPNYETVFDLELRQDLGRNFFGIRDRGNVRLAELGIDQARYTSRRDIETSVAEVQSAYWDLVAQEERAAVARDMVEQAKRLLDVNEEKLRHGLVEDADVLAARANHRRRVNQLLLEQDALATAENVLRLLLNIPDDEARLRPIDDLKLAAAPLAIDEALGRAFAHRRDYRRARSRLESRDVQLVINRQALWPEIELTATFARNGVDADGRGAFSELTAEDNPNTFAGIEVSFPLENRAARAREEAAVQEKARAIVAMKQLERRIMVSIVDGVRRCGVYNEVAANAGAVARLEREKLSAEEKVFGQGRSDTDTVIRFQEDALQARLEALEALRRYQDALIGLRLEEGTMLEEYWEERL